MNHVTRRKVVSAIGAAGAATCICGTQSGCSSFTKVGRTPPIPDDAAVVAEGRLIIDLKKTPQLAEAGGSVKIIDRRLRENLIAARISETEFAVVALLCPHRGVEVEYRHEHGDFRCASLGHSQFQTDGTKIKGLAKKGLTRYEARLDPQRSDTLIVTLPDCP
jgi:Rieske Fe-S protein